MGQESRKPFEGCPPCSSQPHSLLPTLQAFSLPCSVNETLSGPHGTIIRVRIRAQLHHWDVQSSAHLPLGVWTCLTKQEVTAEASTMGHPRECCGWSSLSFSLRGRCVFPRGTDLGVICNLSAQLREFRNILFLRISHVALLLPCSSSNPSSPVALQHFPFLCVVLRMFPNKFTS